MMKKLISLFLIFGICLFCYGKVTTFSPAPASSGISDIIEDTTPELGGNLDCNSKNLTEVGNTTLTTGKTFTIGTTQWNSGDEIDGDKLKNDTVDEDALDFATDNTAGKINLHDFIEGAIGSNQYIYWDGSNWVVGSVSASLPNLEVKFDAASLHAIETNFAPLELLTGSNVKTYVRAFDDTTEEYANGKFMVPTDINTSGTVTFRAYVMAETAAASKNIALTFGHLALNDSEDFDKASPYTEEDSGDKAIDATQDDVTEVTWTETVSNLGWAANDMVLFRLSRDPGATDDLTGDLFLFQLTVEIPRA